MDNDTNTSKTCSVCEIEKPLCEFYNRPQNKTDGKYAACRDCHIARVMASREKNLERYNQYHEEELGPTYSSWLSMKQRCLNPKATSYPYYGGRGITICQEWIDSYATFLRDMGERPRDRTEKGRLIYSLDRIDSEGNYEPSNCRWVDAKTQARNRRCMQAQAA